LAKDLFGSNAYARAIAAVVENNGVGMAIYFHTFFSFLV
jgi:hypothetical protein